MASLLYKMKNRKWKSKSLLPSASFELGGKGAGGEGGLSRPRLEWGCWVGGIWFYAQSYVLVLAAAVRGDMISSFAAFTYDRKGCFFSLNVVLTQSLFFHLCDVQFPNIDTSLREIVLFLLDYLNIFLPSLLDHLNISFSALSIWMVLAPLEYSNLFGLIIRIVFPPRIVFLPLGYSNCFSPLD